ncbi:MAG: sulfotransferase [Colwellia sp.]|nr:sulfotransferase [Colwellia sp.]MCW8866507.1 sulfotransferase [Colwellia sp.]MCW9080696.1 sulfotransferase [Colwellia sp.]
MNDKPKLVLLFGLPRSGTTWIGKLFDSNKHTNYLHEPDSVEPDFNIPLLMKEHDALESRLKDNVKRWLKPSAEKVIASRPFFKKSYMSAWQWSLFVLSSYAGKLFAKLKLPLFTKPIRMHKQAPVTVWKSIESLGRMSAIQLFSDACAVQIIRHPCGQIASTFRGENMKQFDGSIPTSEDWDLFDKLLKQSGETRFSLDEIKLMEPEERLAIRWGIINDFALKAAKGNKSIVLIYEDLCRNPKAKITEIFAQVGLSLEQETLDYIAESTGKEDSAYYATKKTPLTAAYKWRDELTDQQQQRILQIVKRFDAGKYYLNDF